MYAQTALRIVPFPFLTVSSLSSSTQPLNLSMVAMGFHKSRGFGVDAVYMMSVATQGNTYRRTHSHTHTQIGGHSTLP